MRDWNLDKEVVDLAKEERKKEAKKVAANDAKAARRMRSSCARPMCGGTRCAWRGSGRFSESLLREGAGAAAPGGCETGMEGAESDCRL